MTTMIREVSKPPRREWWEDEGGFFGQRYVEGDDSLVGYRSMSQKLVERTQREVDGICNLLHLKPGQLVLDCPCGYGRHSIRLARAGLHVTGVDINTEHLALARARAQGVSNLLFITEDMRRLNFEDLFDSVVNMFFSFGFFESHHDNMKVLENFYRALKPGGRFLMHTDVNMSRLMQGSYKLSEERPLQSGRILRINERYNARTRRIEGTWTLVGDGNFNEQLTPYSVRVFTFEEFKTWCLEVGFQKVEGFGEWEGTPLSDESEDMMVVATK